MTGTPNEFPSTPLLSPAAEAPPSAGIRADTLLLDENLCVRSYTAGIQQLLGLSQEEIGRPIGDLMERIGRSTVLADIRAAHRELSVHERQVCLGYPPRHYLARVEPCYLDSALTEGLVVTLADITELKRAQAQRDRLAAIVDSSGDAIIATALDGTIATSNPAATAILGYQPDEIFGQPFTLLVPMERRAEVELLYELLRSGHEPALFETPLLRKEAGSFPASVRLSPLRDDAGQLAGASAIIRDITLQRQAEEQLQQHAREMEAFAATISHDLRSPMLSIEGCAEVIQELLQDGQEPGEHLAMLCDSVRHLGSLVKGLLNYARLGAQGVVLVQCDCDEMLRNVLVALRADLVKAQAEITHDRLPVILGDEKMLPHVFQNLIENALRYCGPRPPRVHISATDGPAEWVFRFSDQGIGIAPERAERLFDMYRPHGISGSGGLGLGLPICKKIIESHRGRIWFESSPGAGATFFFAIPKSPPG